MITKEETKKLREIIGYPWITQIMEALNEAEVYNRYEKPYSSVFVSLVFNGKRENKPLEHFIWRMAEQKKEEDDRERERKKAIIGS